jgi:hypothetical protein
MRELTQEQMEQVAGGAPEDSPLFQPGYGRYTAFTIASTPINSSAPTQTGNLPASGEFPSEGRATAVDQPIPPGGSPPPGPGNSGT